MKARELVEQLQKLIEVEPEADVAIQVWLPKDVQIWSITDVTLYNVYPDADTDSAQTFEHPLTDGETKMLQENGFETSDVFPFVLLDADSPAPWRRE